MLRTVITPLVASKLLPGVNAEPLAYVALGGLYGAALYIARGQQPGGGACADIDAVLDAIVDGVLRSASAP